MAWITVPQAIERYGFPSGNAVRQFLYRRPELLTGRRGRAILIDAGSLEREVRKATPPALRLARSSS